ncbi:MAG: putative sulfoacetate transporter SauU [Candidatus Dichloromethanomonas elyunquensis]|nr:MAG: putative sulfoacetate transporter SauU [Candidatus Dichloromethanomonas elyunquensis]
MTSSTNVTESAIKKTLSYRYVVYFFVALAFFFAYFHRTSTAVLAPDLTKAFGIDSAALGFFGSLYFYAYALGQLPAGILADHWGIRKTIALVLFAAVGSVVVASAPNFQIALVGRFLIGLGAGFVYVPAVRMINDWFKSSELGTFTGIMVAIGNSGSFASAGPFVALIAMMGWRGSMNLAGVVLLVVAVVGYLFIRSKPADIGGASPAEIEGKAVASSAKIGIGESLKMVSKSHAFWTIVVMFCAMYGSIMGFQGLWAGPYLMNVFGMTKPQAGALLSLIPLGMIVGCPLSGFISDKLKNRKYVLLAGVIGYTLIWIPLVFMTDSISASAFGPMLFAYGFFGGFFPLLYANLRQHIDGRITGSATGFLNTFVFIVAALFQQLMGIIINQYPVVNKIIPVAAFKASFTFAFATLIIGMLFYITQKKPAA